MKENNEKLGSKAIKKIKKLEADIEYLETMAAQKYAELSEDQKESRYGKITDELFWMLGNFRDDLDEMVKKLNLLSHKYRDED